MPGRFSWLVAFSLALTVLAAEGRGFTVTDDIGMVRFGDQWQGTADPITFSPDGLYFVVQTERGRLDLNRPESTLRIYRIEDVREFLRSSEHRSSLSPLWTFSAAPYSDPVKGTIISRLRWLPDSSGFSFLQTNALGNDQLYLADLEKRTVTALTPAEERVTGYDVDSARNFVYSLLGRDSKYVDSASHDGSAIVGTGRDMSVLLNPQPWRLPHQLWAMVGGKRSPIKDPASGFLPLYWEGVDALSLSPDGRHVVTLLPVSVVPPEWEVLYPPPYPTAPYRIRQGQQDLKSPDAMGYVSEYVMVDLPEGGVTRLVRAPRGDDAMWWGDGGSERVVWSADSRSVVLTNTFVPSGAIESAKEPNRPCLAIVDVVQHSVACLERRKARTTSGFEEGWYDITNARFDKRNDARILIDYINSDRSVTPASYTKTAAGPWVRDSGAAIPSVSRRPIEISVKQSLRDPPILAALDNESHASRILLDPNPQLRDVNFGDVSVVQWSGKADRQWSGGLFLPPGYVPGRRYPLVIQTHGFASEEFRPYGIFPTAFAAQELAAAGIIVLQMFDCPVSLDPEEGPCAVAGYEAAVQKLVGDGRVDADRVGIIGFSRTCYYVMQALTTSALHFKAASITDGANLGYLQYLLGVDNNSNAIARESNAMIGASPFGDGLRVWLERSPEFNMQKVTTPLQTVTRGRFELDFSWEPYATLRYLHKPVDLIVLNTEQHVLTNPRARLASQSGTVDWFRFWLQDYEDPDPAKAEQYARWRKLREMQNANDAARGGAQ